MVACLLRKPNPRRIEPNHEETLDQTEDMTTIEESEWNEKEV